MILRGVMTLVVAGSLWIGVAHAQEKYTLGMARGT
jgi:hypothetical protein